MDKMKQNIRNLFHRANLSGREVQTLRGIITALTKYEKTGKNLAFPFDNHVKNTIKPRIIYVETYNTKTQN